MNAQPLACPPFEQLRAFGLGEKLDPEVDAAITEHLGSCETCSNAVVTISGDDFLARRRAAEQSNHSRGTPVPDGSLGGLAKSLTRAADSKMSAAPVPEDIPPELANHPNYEVVRELGRGGMGVVYLVKNRLMDRPEALKVMATGLAARSGAADRFLQEIRSAAQLTHQYIVQAHAADQVGGILMLSMEYVPDGDLGTLVKDKGPLPVVNACYYIWQVAIALQHAHEKGMVHRDIKPSNLLLLRNGKRHTVKVTDFGLAKARKDNGDAAGLTSAGQMMGTPHYMSPEQARDAAQVDIRADIYSLGCTLYFLLTGQTPFSGGPLEVLWKHREEEPRPVNELRPEVPAEVAAVVAKMMAKEPAERYQTPAEVARALSPHLKRGPRPDVPQGQVPQAEVPTARPGSTEAGTAVPMPLPPDREDQWGDLTFSDAAAATAGPTLIAEPRRRRPLWIWPAVVAGGLIVGLLAAWGAGAFQVKTKDGTIILEGLPADAEVVVNGEVVTVTRNGEEATITLDRDGPHRLKVTKDGTEMFADDVSVTLGGDPVRIRIEPQVAKGQEKIPPTGKEALQYEVELLRNPDCEEPMVDGKLPGWENLSGRWHPLPESAARSQPAPRSGKWFFCPGGEVPDAELRQDVDVSRYAAAIDSGRPTFAFSGYVRSLEQGSAGDITRIRVEYRSADPGAEPLDVYSSGVQYSPAKWLLLADTRKAPPGTRTIRIVLRSTRRGAGTKSNDAWFDDLSLKALPPTEPKQEGAADGFVPLFNKKDLTGWARQDPKDDGIWIVQNDKLVGRGGGTRKFTTLHTERSDYGNFHLKMRLKHDDGVSFLYIRRKDDRGYRVVIGRPDGTQSSHIPRGSLDRVKPNEPKEGKRDNFDVEAKELRIRSGEWFTLEVIAEGDRIRSLLNGEQVAELRDTKGPLPPGQIELFCRGAGAIQIESIEIKELQPPFEVKAGPKPAREGKGNWTKQGDELLCGVQAKELGVILFGESKWTDYDFSADVLFALGSAPFSLLCRQQDETHFYGLVLGGPRSEKAGLLRRLGKDPVPVAPGIARLQNGRWYSVKVSVRGKEMRASVFEVGQTAAIAEFSHNDVLVATGRVGLGVGARPTDGPGAVRIRNVKVTNPEGGVLWYGLPEFLE